MTAIAVRRQPFVQRASRLIESMVHPRLETVAGHFSNASFSKGEDDVTKARETDVNSGGLAQRKWHGKRRDFAARSDPASAKFSVRFSVRKTSTLNQTIANRIKTGNGSSQCCE